MFEEKCYETLHCVKDDRFSEPNQLRTALGMPQISGAVLPSTKGCALVPCVREDADHIRFATE